MQFISNKISVGKSKSFDEICQEYMDKRDAKVVKTSSTKEKVKTAESDEADSSGQLDVEPLHQKGESTNQDSVAGGKSDGDGGTAPSKKSDEEGKDSGQPKAEGSEKFTNDPEVDADASSNDKTKVASKTCKKCNEPCDDCKCEGDCDCTSCIETKEVKEAGIKGSCSDCGKPNFLCKCKKDDKKEDDKKEDDKKEASTSVGFKKIANLTAAEKTRLGDYWKNIFPQEYIEAMLADK